MATKTWIAALALGSAAAAALAHSGVQNPAVMARMNAMSAIGDATKILGTMAKGEVTFDADQAREANIVIARHAAETPALFEAPETDPKSEALPAIWENFEDFTAKAMDLEALALELSGTMSSLAEVQAGVARLSEACKACHADYRE